MVLMVWLILFGLCWMGQAEAACTGASPSWNASNDPTSVQTCVANSRDGDTINIAAGTTAWNAQVSWTNKQIYVKGAGQGNTVIGEGGFVVTMNAPGTYNWRISDMTFSIASMGNKLAIISGGTNGVTKGWRMDHITVTHTSTTITNPLLYIHGITFGVIDHATFNGSGYQIGQIWGYTDVGDETITCSPHCLGYNYWNRNLNLGTDEAIYFEDILVDFDGTVFGADVFDLAYGGSVVVRHSTVNGAFLQSHATGHQGREYAGMKYEIYNNTFTGRNLGLQWAFMRSGTGVLFNNTVTGFAGGNGVTIDGQREAGMSCSVSVSPLLACNGANAYDGNIEANGWPCVSACGRGAAAGFNGTATTQTNVPIYAWNNGSTSTCATGGTCNNTSLIAPNGACGARLLTYLKTTGSPHSNGQVDYVNNGSTPKPGYTPYTYPHPLQAGGAGGNTTPPNAPSGLRVQ